MLDGGDCLVSPPALSISRADMIHRQQVSETSNLLTTVCILCLPKVLIFLFRGMFHFGKCKLD